MRTIRPALAALLLLSAAASGPVAAQTRPAAPRPAAAPAAAAPAAQPPANPVPAAPQQTTASFGDWTLRCNRLGPAPGTPFCEVGQTVQREDRPVAQIAIGRPGRGQPLQLTLLVPPNIVLSAPATLLGPREAEPPLELGWRRCLPAGCIADAPVPDEALGRLRGWAENGRVAFQDGAGRPAALPFSPRGLSQALDALAREDGG